MPIARRNYVVPAIAARARAGWPVSAVARLALALAGALAVLGWLTAPAGGAIAFNLTSDPGMDPAAMAGFQAAADAWSQRIVTPITVNIKVAFSPMESIYLGQTSPSLTMVPYSNFRTALAAAGTSAADAQALGSLPASSFGMLINRTANNPNGAGSDVPYLDLGTDQNNAYLQMSRANAKAVGVLGASSNLDGTITFNSTSNWSFSRSGGVPSDAYDFVGAAMHEIGHVLGFLSGIERLDSGTRLDYNCWNVTPLDLFRYSVDSTASGVIDWTSDARAKYFSLDHGLTNLGGFATGPLYGDGRSASHWKLQTPPLGLMDPTLVLGELGVVSNLDLTAMDVIGYEVVPEPCTLSLVLVGAWVLRRRRI
ncbi:MAG: NF038122 family metalloprotease [Planctomycetota bacterium]|nr:NF038122 family metalloprotease [Planctomycetota bacterium]